MAFSKASSSISAEGRCFVYQDGLQHRVVYHVVYEDGDSEDLLLSQVLPLLAQASAAQGQVRVDEQKPSCGEGKVEAVKKRRRPCPRQPTKQRSSSVGRDWARHTHTHVSRLVCRLLVGRLLVGRLLIEPSILHAKSNVFIFMQCAVKCA